MAVVADITNAALRRLGVLAVGQSATGDDSALAIATLNELLDSWNVYPGLSFAAVKITKVLTPGQASYTVGPASQIVADPRPVRLSAASVTANGMTYSVDVIGSDAYSRIGTLQDTGIPEVMYYNPATPVASLTLYPVPSGAWTLSFDTWTTFANYVSPADVLTLPAGYQRALALTLAVELQDHYGRDLPAATIVRAQNARRALQAINFSVPMLVTGTARGFNILTGDR